MFRVLLQGERLVAWQGPRGSILEELRPIPTCADCGDGIFSWLGYRRADQRYCSDVCRYRANRRRQWRRRAWGIEGKGQGLR
jgi:predicted nucleic acid-binding Zn ribbon protein